jgi:hypothetical protein
MEHVNEPVRDTRAANGPTLFLMVGLPGSGKTFRARELAEERGALRLTSDDWALAIFGQEDRHQEPGGMRWLLEGRLIALRLSGAPSRVEVDHVGG